MSRSRTPRSPAVRFGAAALLLAVVATTTDAPAKQARYRLTVTYTQTDAYESSGASRQDSSRGKTTYVARSPKAFTVTRSPAPYEFVTFKTPVRGTFRAAGAGAGWSVWPAPEIAGFNVCNWSRSASLGGSVSGTVSMTGTRSTFLDLKSGGQSGTSTLDTVCSLTGRSTTTNSGPFEPGVRDDSTLRRADLRRLVGRSFTISDRQRTGGPGSMAPNTVTDKRWHLRFTRVGKKPKVQRWRVQVRGADRWTWGPYNTLGAGVWVEWAIRTTLKLRDGKVKKARTRVEVPDVTPFSWPDGAYEVSDRTVVTQPAYTPKVSKRGKRVTLRLLHADRSLYRVDFTAQVAGPPALEQLRRIGVADPDGTYRRLIDRGPVTEVAGSLVPNNPRVVVRLVKNQKPRLREGDAFAGQLPCAAGTQNEACFLQRGGEEITVTRLK